MIAAAQSQKIAFSERLAADADDHDLADLKFLLNLVAPHL